MTETKQRCLVAKQVNEASMQRCKLIRKRCFDYKHLNKTSVQRCKMVKQTSKSRNSRFDRIFEHSLVAGCPRAPRDNERCRVTLRGEQRGAAFDGQHAETSRNGINLFVVNWL